MVPRWQRLPTPPKTPTRSAATRRGCSSPTLVRVPFCLGRARACFSSSSMGATPPRSIEPWETIAAIQYVDKQPKPNQNQTTTSSTSSSLSRLRLLVLALPCSSFTVIRLCFLYSSSPATRPNI
ncbi:hypothetical protein J3F84DRAFT_156621 [Trichoderma pleuroticola]